MRNSVGSIKNQQHIQIHKHKDTKQLHKQNPTTTKTAEVKRYNDSTRYYIFTSPNKIPVQKEYTVFREHLKSVKGRFVSKH
jgi:hypothetical protein